MGYLLLISNFPKCWGLSSLKDKSNLSTRLFGCLIGKFKEKLGCPGLSLTLCSSISFPPAVVIPTWSYLILSFPVRKFLCLLPKHSVSHIILRKGGVLPSLLCPKFFRNLLAASMETTAMGHV